MRNSNTSLSRCLLIMAWIGIAGLDGAYGLDPARMMSQYSRERWSPQNGLSSGPVYVLAQTADGYLWIGSEGGLTRFDGLTFEVLDTKSAPARQVLGLTSDDQNGLWVRLRGLNLLYYSDGAFRGVRRDLQLAGGGGVTVMMRAAPKAGAGERELIFATAWNGVKVLRRGGSLATLVDPTSLPRSPIISLAQTANGDLWMGTRDNGLVRLAAAGGKAATVTAGLPSLKINCLLSDGASEGDLLVGTDHGIVRWNGREIARGNPFPALGPIHALAMTRDHDGNIWIAAGTDGLLRLNEQGVAKITARDGESIGAVLEDREGNIWFGTGDGSIEHLRDSAFATYSVTEGLPAVSNGPVYASVDEDDRTWFGPASGGLYSLHQGKVAQAAAAEIGQDVVYSIAGRQKDLWIGRQRGGLTHLQANGAARTYTTADGLAQNNVFAVALSRRTDAVWAGTLNAGVSRFENGRFTTYRTGDGLVSNTVTAILESSDGTMWFATPEGLSSLTGDRWRTFGVKDGLPSNHVNCVFEDASGTLWIGTLRGLASIQKNHVTVPSPLPAVLGEQILGITEDQHHWLWLTTENHVVRLKPGTGAELREFQLTDGLQSLEGVKRHRSVVADAHGRIWLSMARGLSVVDVERLTTRSIPALVHIRSISADGTALTGGERAQVPAGSQRVTVEYAGLSLAIPERTRFRYRLEGVDRSWSEPVAARQVIYSNLAPGPYRFRVVASNADGVFDSAEAALSFQVQPLLWQRWWVQVLAAIAAGLAVIALVRRRVQRITRQLNLRFEERLAERARIAGELHDTLLQTVQASKMIADDVRLDESADPAQLRETIDRLSAWLGQAVSEGRAALQSLRAPAAEHKSDLTEALQQAAEVASIPSTMAFTFSVEGAVRKVHPMVRDEVYRIGCEAIRNATVHSGATALEVNLRYARDLTMWVKDNGRGFDPEVLANGKPGHFGLQGMQERAIRINGKFRLLSRPNAGTEVILVVPGSVMFYDSTVGSAGRLYRRLRGLATRRHW